MNDVIADNDDVLATNDLITYQIFNQAYEESIGGNAAAISGRFL